MKLPSPSIRKLFREDFSGLSPLIVDRANLPAESERYRSLICGIEGVNLTRHPGDRDSRSRTLCRFTIPDPGSDEHYYRRDELRLEYDGDSRLTLHSYQRRESKHSATVSDIEEIRTLVRHVLEAYSRRAANAKKRERSRLFKSKAVLAQVRKLAGEEGFDFAMLHDTVKIRLFIRLSGHELIEVSVPFKQFEHMLPRLRETLLSLRQLHAEGLRFRIMPVRRLPPETEWVCHETS